MNHNNISFLVQKLCFTLLYHYQQMWAVQVYLVTSLLLCMRSLFDWNISLSNEYDHLLCIQVKRNLTNDISLLLFHQTHKLIPLINFVRSFLFYCWCLFQSDKCYNLYAVLFKIDEMYIFQSHISHICIFFCSLCFRWSGLRGEGDQEMPHWRLQKTGWRLPERSCKAVSVLFLFMIILNRRAQWPSG